MEGTERSAEAGFPDPQRLIIDMFPGICFGFPPEGLDGMMERLGCAACQEVMGLTAQLLVRTATLSEQVAAFQDAVVARNRSREDSVLARIPLIGRFLKARLEPLPDPAAEEWYCDAKQAINALMDAIDVLHGNDPRHWGDASGREIGVQLATRYAVLRQDGCHTK
jgi:hypothetical protein